MEEGCQRLCINCGQRAGELGSDAYLRFFCNQCNVGFQSNRSRNNVFVKWAAARHTQVPDISLVSGQSDDNWPDGFPARFSQAGARRRGGTG